MSALNWKPFVYGGLASITAECGKEPWTLEPCRMGEVALVCMVFKCKVQACGIKASIFRQYFLRVCFQTD